MRKTAVALVLVTALGGCMSFETGSSRNPGPGGPGGAVHNGVSKGPRSVPGMVGPMGAPVPMVEPYASARPGLYSSQAMLNSSVPLNMVQFNGPNPNAIQLASGQGMPGSGVVQANVPPGGAAPPIPVPPGGLLSPPGMPAAPGAPAGPMVPFGPPRMPPYNAVAAVGAMADKNQIRFPIGRTQVRFVRPSGMKVSWYTTGSDGKGVYSESPIEVPGRYNFAQAAIYRLKLTNLEGRPGLEVYPTLEVVPANPKTEAFLAHSAVPIDFTQEDFRQIAAGNYVVKVIYLPDPQNQDLAVMGPDEIISTQLEPGADPIAEARRRGSILLVIRMGNVDQEAPNTPPIGAPAPGAGAAGQMMGAPGPMGMMPGMPQMPMMPPMMGMGGAPPGPMVPYGAQMPQQPLVGSRPPMPNLGMMPPQMPGMPGMPMPGMMPPGARPPATSGPMMMPPQMPMQPPPGIVPASNGMRSSMSAAGQEPGGLQLTSATNLTPPPAPSSPRATSSGSVLGNLMPAVFRSGSDCGH